MQRRRWHVAGARRERRRWHVAGWRAAGRGPVGRWAGRKAMEGRGETAVDLILHTHQISAN